MSRLLSYNNYRMGRDELANLIASALSEGQLSGLLQQPLRPVHLQALAYSLRRLKSVPWSEPYRVLEQLSWKHRKCQQDIKQLVLLQEHFSSRGLSSKLDIQALIAVALLRVNEYTSLSILLTLLRASIKGELKVEQTKLVGLLESRSQKLLQKNDKVELHQQILLQTAKCLDLTLERNETLLRLFNKLKEKVNFSPSKLSLAVHRSLPLYPQLASLPFQNNYSLDQASLLKAFSCGLLPLQYQQKIRSIRVSPMTVDELLHLKPTVLRTRIPEILSFAATQGISIYNWFILHIKLKQIFPQHPFASVLSDFPPLDKNHYQPSVRASQYDCLAIVRGEVVAKSKLLQSLARLLRGEESGQDGGVQEYLRSRLML